MDAEEKLVRRYIQDAHDRGGGHEMALRMMARDIIELEEKRWQRATPPQVPRHKYKPHPKWPWFCESCGYPEHEKLKHI